MSDLLEVVKKLTESIESLEKELRLGRTGSSVKAQPFDYLTIQELAADDLKLKRDEVLARLEKPATNLCVEDNVMTYDGRFGTISGDFFGQFCVAFDNQSLKENHVFLPANCLTKLHPVGIPILVGNQVVTADGDLGCVDSVDDRGFCLRYDDGLGGTIPWSYTELRRVVEE